MASSFQVKLAGSWKDFDRPQDQLLKKAYLSGLDLVPYRLGDQKYRVDFRKMTQTNLNSSKSRVIRPPHGWSSPKAAPAGERLRVRIPEGAPGSCIYVPDPRNGKYIVVEVPSSARPGAPMLVPLPLEPPSDVPSELPPKPFDSFKPSAPAATTGSPRTAEGAATAATALAPAAAPAKPGAKRWSTGAKVAAGGAAALAVGGLAVAGVVLGEEVAEEGWDGVAADLGEALTDTGDAVVHAMEDVGEWVADAAHETGDFLMELF